MFQNTAQDDLLYRNRGKPSTQQGKIKMHSTQSKNWHSIKQDYIFHNKEKTQFLETKWEIT